MGKGNMEKASQKATTWTNGMGQTGKGKSEKGETKLINQ